MSKTIGGALLVLILVTVPFFVRFYLWPVDGSYRAARALQAGADMAQLTVGQNGWDADARDNLMLEVFGFAVQIRHVRGVGLVELGEEEALFRFARREADGAQGMLFNRPQDDALWWFNGVDVGVQLSIRWEQADAEFLMLSEPFYLQVN